MGTLTDTGTMTWPAPLGKIFPGASYATISVPLTQNISPAQKNRSTGGLVADNMFNGIFIKADPANIDDIFVCNSAAAPDTVNYTNVLDKLSAGATYFRSKEWANNRPINTLFIGALNGTDCAIVSIDQF